MDNRSLVFFLSGLAAAGAAMSIAISCSDQPKAKCTTGHGAFAASYVAKGALPDGGACNLTGEVVGIAPYPGLIADQTNIDPSNVTVWVQGESMSLAQQDLAGAKDPNPNHEQNAKGTFQSSEPSADGFCDVPTLSVAQQDLPGNPDAGTPGSSITYQWSDLRFVVSAKTLGGQMVGELTYTRDGCQAQYHVKALYPSWECGSAGNALDFCACLPYADPDYMRGASPLHPDLFPAPRFGDQACEFGVQKPDGTTTYPNAQPIQDASRVKCQRVSDVKSLCVLKDDPPQ